MPDLTCSSCGAALDAPSDATATSIQCKYCNARVAVAAREHARKPGLGKRLLGLFGVGKLPIRVTGTKTISNRELESDGTLFVLEPFSKLVLRGCTLRGDVIVDAKSGKVVIEDCTLEATKHVVRALMSMDVELRGSTLSAGDNAIDLEMGGKIHARDTTITSKRAAARGGMTFETTLERSTLHGVRYGFEAGQSSKLALSDNSKVTSEEIAVQGGMCLVLDVDHSSIFGPVAGVVAGQSSQITLTNDAEVKSDERAIAMAMSGKLEVTASRIIGGKIAIAAPMTFEAKLRGATVTGRRDLGDSPRVDES